MGVSGRIRNSLLSQNSLLSGKPIANFLFLTFTKMIAFVLGLAFPKTGRQHQIRAHAAHHGYPLIGDKIYHGGLELFGRFKDHKATDQDHLLMEIPRHALHAMAIVFPLDGQMCLVEGQLPKDLLCWIDQNLSISAPSLTKKVSQTIQHHLSCFKKLKTP